MSELTLRSAHRPERKEGAQLGVKLLSRFITGSVVIVMALPFVSEYLGK